MNNMSERAIKQNELEATLLSRLNHPNIVKFIESFREGKSLMICMEYADGGDLENFLKNRRGKLIPENEVLHIFVQLVLAMKHVHDRKILHRDLKSQNVFLLASANGKPTVKLGDFGVSRVSSHMRVMNRFNLFNSLVLTSSHFFPLNFVIYLHTRPLNT
jgi:NIMA (never in mitosis gene a)-related kinase